MYIQLINHYFSEDYVLCTVKVPGGTATAATQTSMDCTLMVRATTLVSHGYNSMLLYQVGVHFAIQTWSWEGATEDLPHCHHSNPLLRLALTMHPIAYINVCTHKWFTSIIFNFFSTQIYRFNTLQESTIIFKLRHFLQHSYCCTVTISKFAIWVYTMQLWHEMAVVHYIMWMYIYSKSWAIDGITKLYNYTL